MSVHGNAWVECWRTVRPVPAHKQKSLFDYEKEAERALHDLEQLPPPAVLGQLLNCIFVCSYHAISAPVLASDVASVDATLNAVKHLLWCGEDQGQPFDRAHCDELCTSFALAERQVTKATSLIAKFNSSVGNLIDLLCTSGRAFVKTDDERQQVLRLLSPQTTQPHASTHEGSDLSHLILPRPKVREYVCRAEGGVKNHRHLLFVRTGAGMFRMATSASSPAI
eukprot:Tamp_25221.p1 GENE.Tamp_25221~~Tamp_25221.p1  ORF type:complete len:224 (+),score=27.26 Tamp_25221:124-795(+)